MASTGVAAATAGVSATTAARGMPAASTRGVSSAARSTRTTTAAARSDRAATAAVARGRVRATVARRSTRATVARSATVAGISTRRRCPRDRLPHIQLRTGRGSAPVAARVRTWAAGFDRTWRSPVPIAAAVAACHRGARCASRHLAARWRSEGPEAVPVAGRSRRRHTALRFHGSRTHVRRTRVWRIHIGWTPVRPFRTSKRRRASIAARRRERTISATVSSLR